MIDHQKGTTLYFAIVVMSVLLAAAFSISSIVLVQIRTIKGAGDSVLAFYAADTGIETALADLHKGNYLDPTYDAEFEILLDGSSYKCNVKITQPASQPLGVTWIESTSDCEGEYYCIKSTGIYGNVKRAIEVKG